MPSYKVLSESLLGNLCVGTDPRPTCGQIRQVKLRKKGVSASPTSGIPRFVLWTRVPIRTVGTGTSKKYTEAKGYI